MPDTIATTFVEIKPMIDDASIKRSMDSATKVVKREANQMERALEGIDSRDAFNDVERDAERSTEKATGHFKEMARQSGSAVAGIGKGFGGITGKIGLLGGAVAGLGLGAFFKSAFDSATEAESVFRRTEAVVKSTGKAAGLTAQQIDEFAQNLSLKIGVDDEEIQSASTQLLAFKNVTGDTFLRAQELAADVSATFAGTGDASAKLVGSTKLLGKALNDPVKGMNALRRVGVTFTEEQQDMIEGMVNMGDVTGAQVMIMKQLEERVGGAAEASATAGQKISVSFDALKEAAGAGLSGALEGLVPTITKLFDKIGPILGKLGDTFGKALGPIIDALGPALMELVDQFAPVIEQISGIIMSLAPIVEPLIQVFGSIARVIGGALSTAFEALAPVIELVAEFLGDFAKLIGDEMTDAIEDIAPVLGDIASVIADGLGAILPTILDLFREIAPIIGKVGGIIGDALVAILPTLYDLISDLVPIIAELAEIFGGVLSSVLPILADAFMSIFDAVKPLIPILADGILQIVDALAPVLPTIARALGTVAESFAAILVELTPLIPPLLDLATLLIETIGVPVLEALASAIALVAEALAAIVGAIAGVIKDLGPKLTTLRERFAEVWNKIRDKVLAVFRGIRDFFKNVWTKIRDTVVGIVQGVRETFGSVWEKIRGKVEFVFDAIKLYFTTIFNIYKRIVTTAIGIIRETISRVIGAIKTTWETVWDGVRTTLFNVWDRIKTIVSGAIGIVKTTVETVTGTIKTIWRDAWDAVVSKFRLVKDTLKGIIDAVWQVLEPVVNTIKDGVINAFELAVSGVETAWNLLKSVVRTPINVVIGFYNQGIRRVWNAIISKIPGIGDLPEIPRVEFARGGRVPGTGSRDTVPAMLTPGEFVVTKKAAKFWGAGILKMLNNPSGTIDPGIFGYQQGGYARGADEALDWARTHAGAPYVFAAAGPGTFDCSGWTSALVNYILGHPNPYFRRHSSGTVGSDSALRPGTEGNAFVLGARPPYTTNSQGARVGHVVATLAGVNTESTPPALLIGGSARSAYSMPQLFHLPGYTGLTDADYEAAKGVAGLKGMKLTGLTAPLGDVLQKMINRLPGIVFDFLIKKLPKLIFDTVWNIIKVATPFEHGGRIMRNGPITVGESGPELMWGSRGQYVASLNASGNPTVQVFIGDHEVTDFITRVVRNENNELAAQLRVGTR